MDTLHLFDDSQLRPALLAKLQNKLLEDPLTRSEWSEVATIIVNHEKMLNRSLNMTHARYMELADQALVQWPALLVGCTPKQALSRVKSKVQWRVRNAKRPEPSLQKPVKRAGSQMLPPAKASKAPRYENFEGYEAYLPPPPEEDIQQARNKLKQEGLGAEERAALLSLTFPDRRQHAVALRTPMKKFLHLYPALKDHDEIWLELGRISGGTGTKRPDFQKRLSDYLTAVQLVTDCDDDDRVDALLEYLLTNPEEIFGEQVGSSPHIEEHEGGVCSLVIEEQRVVSLKATKADLLLLWAASFPVFNQKTPAKTAKNALAFITSHVFEKGCGIMGNRAHGRALKLKRMIE